MQFTHTTHKVPVYIWADQIIAVFYMPTFKSAVLVGPGSTAIPVEGEVDEIRKKINTAKQHGVAAANKEET